MPSPPESRRIYPVLSLPSSSSVATSTHPYIDHQQHKLHHNNNNNDAPTTHRRRATPSPTLKGAGGISLVDPADDDTAAEYAHGWRIMLDSNSFNPHIPAAISNIPPFMQQQHHSDSALELGDRFLLPNTTETAAIPCSSKSKRQSLFESLHLSHPYIPASPPFSAHQFHSPSLKHCEEESVSVQPKQKQKQQQKQQQRSTKLYLCTHEGCQQEFKTQWHLLSHQNCHSQTRSFSCLLCPLSFARKHDLTRHQRSVHAAKEGAPTFLCETCEKGFGRVDSLRRHRKVCRGTTCRSSLFK
ncbi:hypothetical protein BJ741DRAFT_705971 [Chytriomyces cf. hyalinus JEL632]|nr:hypothetical protein BJ741DRAFT_705971 [Chytriomyces cf. hyalinus JEL632]